MIIAGLGLRTCDFGPEPPRPDGDAGSKIKEKARFQLPPESAGASVGMNMIYDGYIVFPTEEVVMVAVSPDLTRFEPRICWYAIWSAPHTAKDTTALETLGLEAEAEIFRILTSYRLSIFKCKTGPNFLGPAIFILTTARLNKVVCQID